MKVSEDKYAFNCGYYDAVHNKPKANASDEFGPYSKDYIVGYNAGLKDLEKVKG